MPTVSELRPRAVRPRIGDKEVAAGEGQDARFGDVARLSSERRATIEIVPECQRCGLGAGFCFDRTACRERC
jgi:hypothetical protein